MSAREQAEDGGGDSRVLANQNLCRTRVSITAFCPQHGSGSHNIPIVHVLGGRMLRPASSHTLAHKRLKRSVVIYNIQFCVSLCTLLSLHVLS